MTEALELRITRTIPAPRKAVFEAWLSPASLQEFMMPGPGMSVPKTEVDAREGGAFLIVMKAGDEEMPHRGEYRTIQRYDRIAFTWISPATIPGSLVTLDFRDQGDATELTLHHVGFPNAQSRDNHDGGWGGILDALSTSLG